MSFETAASIPCAGLSAYQSLSRKMHVNQGETVAVYGAGGGVGSWSVVLASAMG